MTVEAQRIDMFFEGIKQLPEMAQPVEMSDAERLHQVKTTFLAKLNRRMAVDLESCVHCGQCAEACHYYNATQDPKYTPVRKVELIKRVYDRELSPTRWLRRLWTREITLDEVKEWIELVYDSCTECGRCFMVCPMGINIPAMVNVSRQAFANAGLIPVELRAMEQEQYAGNTLFGIGPDQTEAAIREIGEQMGVEVPFNKEKADVLLLTSVVEVMVFTDQIASAIKVLNHLKLNWTLHMDGFEAANFGMLSGFEPLQKRAGDRIVKTAKKIGAKTILVPECGHAFPSLRWEQANVDEQTFPFEVLTMAELMARELRNGNLRVKPGVKGKSVTFHDPCKIGRHSGVFEEPRAMIKALGAEFREADSSQAVNWCCGGGAGVFLLNSAADLRQGAWKIKQAQIDATGADEVVLSCASCRLNFERGARNNHWDKPIDSLLSMVAENLDE